MKKLTIIFLIAVKFTGCADFKELAEITENKSKKQSEIQMIIDNNKRLSSKSKILERENNVLKQKFDSCNETEVQKLKESLDNMQRNLQNTKKEYDELKQLNNHLINKIKDQESLDHENQLLKEENLRLKKANNVLKEEIELDKDRRTFIQKKEEAMQQRKEKRKAKIIMIKEYKEKLRYQRLQSKGFLTIVESDYCLV